MRRWARWRGEPWPALDWPRWWRRALTCWPTAATIAARGSSPGSELRAAPSDLLGALARRALAGVGLAALVAAGAYLLAYRRQMRRTVEQSGIAPSRRAFRTE